MRSDKFKLLYREKLQTLCRVLQIGFQKVPFEYEPDVLLFNLNSSLNRKRLLHYTLNRSQGKNSYYKSNTIELI